MVIYGKNAKNTTVQFNKRRTDRYVIIKAMFDFFLCET